MSVCMGNNLEQVKNTGLEHNVCKNSQVQNKKESVVSKTVLGASLVGLVALASVGIYLVTKGKVKPASKNNSMPKIENLINEFKSKNEQYKDVEPIISTLKNGKTKVELKNGTNRDLFIFGKEGDPERKINFNETGYVSSIWLPKNNCWQTFKTKGIDVETKDILIKEYSTKINPRTKSCDVVKETYISRDKIGDISETTIHSYIKRDGPANEHIRKLRLMQDGDGKIGTLRIREVDCDKGIDNTELFTIINNKRFNKKPQEVFTEAQMAKWRAQLEV